MTKMDLAARERNTRSTMSLVREQEAATGPEQIRITQIRADGGTQMRAGLNSETVAEYAEWLTDLARTPNGLLQMPPVVVYHDGTDYWLADGFHRLAAWKSVGGLPTAIQAEVRSGDRRKAILHAAGANAEHGLRRTNADKRRAVETLLRDEEWRAWSDAEIGRKCAVNDKTVGNIRRELSSEFPKIDTSRTVTRGGMTYRQETTNIGPKVKQYIPEGEELEAMQEVAQEGAEEEAERLAIGDGEIKSYQPQAPAIDPIVAKLADPETDTRELADLFKVATIEQVAQALAASGNEGRQTVLGYHLRTLKKKAGLVAEPGISLSRFDEWLAEMPADVSLSDAVKVFELAKRLAGQVREQHGARLGGAVGILMVPLSDLIHKTNQYLKQEVMPDDQ